MVHLPELPILEVTPGNSSFHQVGFGFIFFF